MRVPGIFEPVDNRRYNNRFEFLKTMAPVKNNIRYNITIPRFSKNPGKNQRQQAQQKHDSQEGNTAILAPINNTKDNNMKNTS
jgi:hypothetical protein